MRPPSPAPGASPAGDARLTIIYRYGPLAWVWRVLIAVGLVAGGVAGAAGLATMSPWLVAFAAPLLAPAVFFAVVVAYTIEWSDEGWLRVTTLMFGVRRVSRSALGRARVRRFAETVPGPLYAPRAWIPVKGAWPIYVDLLADIPDRSAFANVLGIEKKAIPRSRSPDNA